MRPGSTTAGVLALCVMLPAGGATAQQGHMMGGSGWRMPPMDPDMMVMGTAFSGLVPNVAPFVPGGGIDLGELPLARPGEVVQLTDGDTLRLEAGALRRDIGGQTVLAYGFNGQSPGPTIRVEEGSTIVVEFVNGIHFSTTMRWHGVRLENEFDGVPGLTQRPVRSGESFSYRVHFPDAGAFWYHPHQRAHIAQYLGLYGAIIVDSSDPEYDNPVNREQVMILDDLLVDEMGLIPWGEEAPTHALMGRFGNVLLVNGASDFRTEVGVGEVVRLYLTNAASARPFNLALGGARLKLVAGDLGHFENEEWVSNVVIAPGQRYVVEAHFDEVGDVPLTNSVAGVSHLLGDFQQTVDTLGSFRVGPEPPEEALGEGFGTLRSHASVAAEMEALRPLFDRPPDRELVLGLQVGELPIPVVLMMEADTLYSAPIEWTDPMPMMNWLSTGIDVLWILHEPTRGGDAAEVTPARGWRFAEGEVVKIRLFNDPRSLHPMSHPMHMHGQRFVVLEQDGVRLSNLVWRDTVLVPVGSTVDLLVDMSNPGTWMLNCQISEHVGSGMSMSFTVSPG